MDMKTAIKEYFNRYTDFKGRSRRSAFWWVVLFNIIVGIVLGLIDSAIFGTGGMTQTYENDANLSYSIKQNMGVLGGIYSLATFIPSLANSVRRLHDVGKSGWMLLLWLLPIIGWIWLLVLHVTDSDPGDNNWGPNPKTGISEDDLDEFGVAGNNR